MDKKIDVTIKKVSSNEPNVSKRHTSYDIYHNGKYHTTFNDINDAMDHKEKMHKEDMDLDETVLNIQQRQKRALIMRRNEKKIERAREISKRKMAPEANIRKRAFAKARQIVRKKVAGERGAEYEKLGPSEKIAIDRAVEGKQKLINKLALRLIPRVKQAESKRLAAYMHGKSLENHGQPEGKSLAQESLDVLFAESFPPAADSSSVMGPRAANPVATTGGSKKMPPEGKSKNSNIIQYNKFQEDVQNDTRAFTSLYNKSEKSGIDLEVLGEVYNRGWNVWTEDFNVSQQQYAFARVNSYINQGKTYFNEDADLHEARPTSPEYDASEKSWNIRKKDFDKNSKDGVYRPSKTSTNEELQPSRAYVKRMKRSDGVSVLVSSTKGGRKKYWQDTETGLKKAREHSKTDIEEETGIDEGIDNNHPIVKEYNALKKHDIKTLRGMIAQNNRVIDTSDFKSKDHAATHLIRQKHGNVKVDQAFGFKEEVQQTNENFIDGEGPGKPGDSARHGLKDKSASELKKIRSSDTASPRKKQLAHWMLNMHHNEETELNEAGLWDNIHVKRKRIKAGSGERMRKPGTEGAPTKQDFKDASESIEEGYDVNSKHYKALTDLDLNTKNRDMTTKHDGYGPLNPINIKGSKPFWDDKAKMWNTTTEAAMEARCGNCAAFNQAPAIMKKMAEGLGPAGEKIQELSNLGFCELFEFKCAGDRTCNKWLVNGPITEEDTDNGTSLIDKESKNSKARKKIEVVDRKPPHTEYTRQAEIKQKIIDEKLGNKVNDPKNRLLGTNSLTAAYKADTPGENKKLDESFNIAFASGVGVTLTSKDLGMQMQSSFALHPSVVEQAAIHDQCGTPQCCGQCNVEEEVVSADVKGEVIPAHSKTIVDPKTGALTSVTVPGHVRRAKQRKVIIGSGNVTDGKR